MGLCSDTLRVPGCSATLAKRNSFVFIGKPLSWQSVVTLNSEADAVFDPMFTGTAVKHTVDFNV